MENSGRPTLRLISRIIGVAANLALLAIVVLFIREASGRAFGGSPIGAVEWTALLMAILLALAMPTMALFGPFIKVDILYNILPLRARRYVNGLAQLLVVLVLFGVAYHAIPWAWASIELREVRGGFVTVPLFVGKAMFAGSLFVSAVVSLGQLAAFILGRVEEPFGRGDSTDESSVY